MTESNRSENNVPGQTSASACAVPLEAILCTEELSRRPQRAPDYEKENRALVALVSALDGFDASRMAWPRRTGIG